MENIKRLRDAGYAINFASDKAIEVTSLFFVIEEGKAVFYPEGILLNRNPWAVTRFLNRHGAVNDMKHREQLKQYDKYVVNNNINLICQNEV